MKTQAMLAAVLAALTAKAQVASPTTNAAPASANGSGEEEYVSIITGVPWTKGHRLTLDEYKKRDQDALRRTGGFIYYPAEGPRVLLLDARAKATLTIDEVARLWKLGSKLEADLLKEPIGGDDPLVHAQGVMEARKPLMLVEVVADDRLPALSVFPEERIGIVNASTLKGHSKDPAAPEMRVMKEVWRAIGFIGGLGFSAAKNDVMQPWYTLAELDSTDNAYIQPMAMMGMRQMWDRFGVKKPHKVPYRTAVKQGWASPPTNDLQKAVWDEIKSQTTNATSKASVPMSK